MKKIACDALKCEHNRHGICKKPGKIELRMVALKDEHIALQLPTCKSGARLDSVDALAYAHTAIRFMDEKGMRGCVVCEYMRRQRAYTSDEALCYCIHPEAPSEGWNAAKETSGFPIIDKADQKEAPAWCPKRREKMDHG